MTVAIKFENISKLYRLGEVGTGTLAHDLHRAWAKLRGKPDPFAKVGQVNDRTQSSPSSSRQDPSSSYVWALKDINFEVQQGEILGIIGRNGAGKSTLLKLLSRVTAPTTGSIKSRGRIASLLEVGTGFHPELTGRENIYLNGTILGMRRHEITKQLEEIVEFSGCAKYIDTPVKRYSSGMMVRLGFAVAAHLLCETLVVDEVLAVGDVEFQNKCIGKMRDVANNSGRAVLFVSHNMTAVQSLCTRAILVKHGRVQCDDRPSKVVPEYLGNHSRRTEGSVRRELEDLASGVVRSPAEKTIRVNSACIVDEAGSPIAEFRSDQQLFVEVVVTVYQPAPNLRCIVFLKNCEGKAVLISQSLDSGKSLHSFPPGIYKFRMGLPANLFGETELLVDLHLLNPKTEHLEYEDLFRLQCNFIPNEISSYGAYENAFLRPVLPWQVVQMDISNNTVDKVGFA